MSNYSPPRNCKFRRGQKHLCSTLAHSDATWGEIFVVTINIANFDENLRNVDIHVLSNTFRMTKGRGNIFANFLSTIIELLIGFYEKFDFIKLKKFRSILKIQVIAYDGTSTGQLKNLRNVDIRHLSNTFCHRYLEKGNAITSVFVSAFIATSLYFYYYHSVSC